MNDQDHSRHLKIQAEPWLVVGGEMGRRQSETARYALEFDVDTSGANHE